MTKRFQNKRTNIAIFMAKFSCGGAERIMINLSNYFVEMGLSVDIIVAMAEGPFREQVSKKVRVVDLRVGRPLYSLYGLTRYLREKKPEVLLSPIYNCNIIALLARRIAKVPTRVVVREANTLSEITKYETKVTLKIARLFMPYLYPWADEIIAISKGVAEDLSKTIRIKLDRISVIYNPVIPIDLSGYKNKRIEHDWFRSDKIPVIISVGRLNKAKDFKTLILSFSRVLKHRKARLLIIGEGEQRNNLENLVSQLGIKDSVLLLGYVDNPYAYMANSSLFVLSSLFEGFGCVLVEAIAVGIPVISTNCKSGPSEILDGGKYGKLVPIRNPEALSEAILSVLADGPIDVPSSWLEQFTIDHGAKQYLSTMGF